MSSSIFIICVAFLALSSPSAGQRRNAAKILTEAGHFEGELDGSVTLPCSISNIGRRSVFWFKGKTPDERELIMQMKNIRGRIVVPRQFQQVVRSGKLAADGTDLIVKHLTMEDADSYTCSMAWARQTVTHTLDVNEVAAPQEMLVTYEPSNMRAEATVGGFLTLTCNATGDPLPTVTWYKEEKFLQEGASLVLSDVRREDAGTYVCRSSNGVVPDQEGAFTVQVPYVEVKAEVTKVLAQSDLRQAQLACRVSGDPQPQVVWYNSEGPVPDDDTHRYFSHDDIHYLQLEQMTPNDLGNYQCYVYNQWSRDLATVTVVAVPGPVHVLQATPTHDPLTYNITWGVESLAPISFYYFTFRQEGSEEVISSSVKESAEPQGNGTHYLKSTLLTLNPGITYQFLIRAVTEEHQAGQEMTDPFNVSVPELPAWGVMEDKELWKVLKRTLNIISRLPQVVRALQ